MVDYISQSMTNHAFAETSSEDIEHLYSNAIQDRQMNRNMHGGNSENENIDRPTGGFPPIFIITSKEEVEQKNTKNRELVSNKATVSIKAILASKK